MPLEFWWDYINPLNIRGFLVPGTVQGTGYCGEIK